MKGLGLAIVLGLLMVVAACSSGEDEPWAVAGDLCEDLQAGALSCGSSTTGDTAVLRCEVQQLYLRWAVLEVCEAGCRNALCEGGETDIPAQDTVVPPLDAAVPEVDAAVEPPDGMMCFPSQAFCPDEDNRAVCFEDGSGFDTYPCDAGKKCDGGYCKDLLCSPGEKNGECYGPTSVAICNASGTGWEGESCPDKVTCYLGECTTLGCPPEAKACKGVTAVQECLENADGEWEWVVTQQCEEGLCMDGACLSSCEANVKEFSYLGCDYWAADLDNIEGGAAEAVAIVVSVPTSQSKSATITITDMSRTPPVELSGLDLGVNNLDVAPGELQIFTLPLGRDVDGSVQTSRTFRVTSTSPVTVHQFNPLNGEDVYTNDASLLLPSNVGGTEYIVLSWPQKTVEDAILGTQTYRGFVSIVATQEGVTKVDVEPSTQVLAGANVPSMTAGGGPYLFYLERGDILNLESTGSVGSDLTGTLIRADKKIQVFSGHECANVPLSVNYCDHIEQQLYPVQSWGTHYVADAFSQRNGSQQDTWRVVAGADGVQVTLEPELQAAFTLSKGEWKEFSTSQSFELNATGPVLLGHYLQGSNYPGFSPVCGTTGIGDPAFALGVPVQQYLQEYIVLTPPGYQENYINIIHPKNSLIEFQVNIDGQSVLEVAPPGLNPVAVGSGEYAVLQLPVEPGVHTVSAQTAIGVTAYGYDCDVSYAYPGGLSLKTLTE